MNEEKIEEILKRRDESMQRYIAGLIEESDRKTGALSEEFQSRLSTVAEGVVGLGEKVDLLKENVDLLNEKVDRIEITQNAHTEMIGIIAEDVSVLKDDVSEIKTELKNKVSRPEFIELKQTVLAMS